MYTRKGAVIVDCSICHKPFPARPYKARSGKPLCCSRVCEGLRRRQERRESRTCLECNTIFEVHKSEVRKSPGHGTLCSTRCRDIRAKETHKGKVVSQETKAKMSAAKKGITPWNKEEPVIAVCPNCHNDFEYRPATRVRRIQTFCTQDCYVEFVRKYPQYLSSYRGGKKNHNYGPGWTHLANTIRARDNHTCQNCGIRQVKPKHHVHHKVPFRLFDGDLAKANDSSNLVTLCLSCHTSLEPHNVNSL